MEKTKVCVTGGSSFLGSRLVKKLLEKGYIVHATLRTLGLSLTTFSLSQFSIAIYIIPFTYMLCYVLYAF